MKYLYGAILGDLVGMPYEKNPNIPEHIDIHPEGVNITDDSVMTLATACAILKESDFTEEYKYWGNKYFSQYYGKSFKEWLKSEEAYINHSYGNGCLMRLSPIPYWAHDDKSGFMMASAIDSISGSHDHKDSARSVMILCEVYSMILQGRSKFYIEAYLKTHYPIPDELVKFEKLDATCQGTLPFVLRCFLNSNSTHEAILTAVKYGGDTDTNASIAGELANAYYKDISYEDVKFVHKHLNRHQLKTLQAEKK